MGAGTTLSDVDIEQVKQISSGKRHDLTVL